jgi:two-component system cell cycle response regulator
MNDPPRALRPDGDAAERASPARFAHDARGPISVIRAHARLLMDGRKGELSEEQRRSLAVIERQTHRLGRLVDELETELVVTAPIPPTPAPAPPLSIEESRVRILLADDDDAILELLVELLSSRYEVTLARDGGEALRAMDREMFHLAIVDLDLPVANGFAIAEAIGAANEHESPAFMFLSGHSNAEAKVQGLSLGAADYVTKPFEPEELLARIARVVAGVAREATLRADAMTDSLTGLFNYRSLTQTLEQEISRARRYAQPLSLITLDLDYLKAINDEHGHDAGNEAIRLVGDVLKGAVRSFEMVARQGGDEFAVILPNTGKAEAEHLAQRLCQKIAAQAVRGIRLSASVGVASREPTDTIDAAALQKASDEALYLAKRAGRGRVAIAR